MPSKMIIKMTLSTVFSACGVFYALNRYRLLNKAFVLMYHRVLSPNDLQKLYIEPGMYVTSRSFDRQISFLKKNYHILFLEELLEKIKMNKKVGGCCAITFDDGWLDNYTNAYPILKQYQAPATIFLATSFIDTNRLFWPDEICGYLVREHMSPHGNPSSAIPVLRFHREIEKYASNDKNIFLDKAIEVLKGYSPDDRNLVLEYFRGMGKPQHPPRQMLSWQEADEMKNSGLITFGSHTAGHEILDQLPVPNVRREISRSREEIERRLGVKVTTFAYPNGNHNENVQKVLKEFDFIGAVTTRRGFLTQDTQLMAIPRIGIHEDISKSIPMFRGRILLERF